MSAVDLTWLLLITVVQEGEERLTIKLNGAAALLLVESDEARCRKFLRRENGKWILRVTCNKKIRGTLNTALMAFKKLAKVLKSCDLDMNPHRCMCNYAEESNQLTLFFTSITSC